MAQLELLGNLAVKHRSGNARNPAPTQLRKANGKSLRLFRLIAPAASTALTSAPASRRGKSHQHPASALRILHSFGEVQSCNFATPAQIGALGIDSGEDPARAGPPEPYAGVELDGVGVVLVHVTHDLGFGLGEVIEAGRQQIRRLDPVDAPETGDEMG